MMQCAQAKPAIANGATASQGVLEVVAEFGGWLLECDDAPVFHVDGRVFLSSSERSARKIPDNHYRYQFAAAACSGKLKQFIMQNVDSKSPQKIQSPPRGHELCELGESE